eukprot:Lankesteria_metandrocarpae@DN9488_c0_g1_i1.p1
MFESLTSQSTNSNRVGGYEHPMLPLPPKEEAAPTNSNMSSGLNVMSSLLGVLERVADLPNSGGAFPPARRNVASTKTAASPIISSSSGGVRAPSPSGFLSTTGQLVNSVRDRGATGRSIQNRGTTVPDERDIRAAASVRASQKESDTSHQVAYQLDNCKPARQTVSWQGSRPSSFERPASTVPKSRQEIALANQKSVVTDYQLWNNRVPPTATTVAGGPYDGNYGRAAVLDTFGIDRQQLRGELDDGPFLDHTIHPAGMLNEHTSNRYQAVPTSRDIPQYNSQLLRHKQQQIAGTGVVYDDVNDGRPMMDSD